MPSSISNSLHTSGKANKKFVANAIALLVALSSIYCSGCKSGTTEVPDIKGKLLNGDSVSLGTIAKNKLTVVNVWGIFCGPCMQELPIIQSVYEKYRNNKDLAFITVAMDSERELDRFLHATDTTDPYRKLFLYSKVVNFSLPTISVLPHGYTHKYGGYGFFQDSTEARIIAKKVNSDAIPTTLIYNPDGSLVFRHIGSFDNDQLLTHKIDSLLSH